MVSHAVRTLAVLSVLSAVSGDLYLHVPRGSNNRLNEKSATRANNNRLFDSQNNARGGYNVGDKGTVASGLTEGNQYNMKYFQSSTTSGNKGRTFLNLEWTDQHGCGGNENTSPQKQNCDLVLQYMCQDIKQNDDKYRLRNGVSTRSQDFNLRKPAPTKKDRGLHEPRQWYNKCVQRKRNKGLFTADQTLNGNTAQFTRQNPNGGRSGYECPEERDYFPYWHPTPWKDIAILAVNTSMCSHYTSKSFNVQPYSECIESKGWSTFNNEADCVKNKGRWLSLHNYLEKATDKSTKESCEATKVKGLTYQWLVPRDSDKNYQPECLVMLGAPDCKEAPWSRSNHLGNGRNGHMLNYPWVLPHFPSGNTKRCVFRMRYNISTDDYDPYHTDSKQNKGQSPIKNNPKVTVASGYSKLQLAINTAQYGRVFQDRSHVFLLKPRPAYLINNDIYNVNVRGKRGNIVQTFPAMEYDFSPTRMTISTEDLVHFQWTGSNTHNNGPNGGDGDTGDAGQGTAGTDRNNVLEFEPQAGNYPTPYEQTKMWENVEIMWIYHGKKDVGPLNLAINMASSGYYRCIDANSCPEKEHAGYLVKTKHKMNALLNNAPASYEGVVLRFKKSGKYNYMCTRNNNFSNRSQKGMIVVKNKTVIDPFAV